MRCGESLLSLPGPKETMQNKSMAGMKMARVFLCIYEIICFLVYFHLHRTTCKLNAVLQWEAKYTLKMLNYKQKENGFWLLSILHQPINLTVFYTSPVRIYVYTNLYIHIHTCLHMYKSNIYKTHIQVCIYRGYIHNLCKHTHIYNVFYIYDCLRHSWERFYFY